MQGKMTYINVQQQQQQQYTALRFVVFTPSSAHRCSTASVFASVDHFCMAHIYVYIPAYLL